MILLEARKFLEIICCVLLYLGRIWLMVRNADAYNELLWLTQFDLVVDSLPACWPIQCSAVSIDIMLSCFVYRRSRWFLYKSLHCYYLLFMCVVLLTVPTVLLCSYYYYSVSIHILCTCTVHVCMLKFSVPALLHIVSDFSTIFQRYVLSLILWR